MLGRIARKLGFEQSVPVSVIEDWFVPNGTQAPIELAPREGAAGFEVDEFGRLQPIGATWTLEFTLAAGARWLPVAQSERVRQRIDAPGVVETTIDTPSGPVVQRAAAGVVDGKPVGIIEIENTGGVAIAVGAAVRPLQLDGRGYLADIAIDQSGVGTEHTRVVRFDTAPAAVVALEGVDGDVLAVMPDAADATTSATASCRSGGAQAGAVWPLPHTATVRFILELTEPTAAAAAVPTTSDINRGWTSHLKQGFRAEVGGSSVADRLTLASRTLLTQWPERHETPAMISAMAEMGFGRDAARLFETLDRAEDDDAVLRSLARWAQLGEQHEQLPALEEIIGRLARAAHVAAGGGGSLAGEGWLDDALVALGGALYQIDQPDVAERVQQLSVANPEAPDLATREAELAAAMDKRGVWPERPVADAAEYVRVVRRLLVDDHGSELNLLPAVPTSWRGQPIDVFALPVANGSLSFGLRWHGPRPALLWEASLAPEAPVTLRVPGIDPSFSSTEREGEVLLEDPGWNRE